MKLRYDLIDCYVVRPDAEGTSFEFLQLRRAEESFLGGTWQAVHGKIEGDEKVWQAALRELWEETRLEPREFYQLDTVNVFYMAADDCIWHCPGFCVLVDREAKVVLNEEHDDFRWIPRSDIENNFIWPGQRLALSELCREILDNGPSKSYLLIKT